MFTGLTNLLFGRKESENTEFENYTATKTPPSFNTKEEDDGWIVVSNRTNSNKTKGIRYEDLENNRAVVLDINCDIDEEEDGENFNLSQSTPLVVTPTPSTPSSLAQLDPDGSWYLTPPPCFTAGISTSSFVVSPMENLLIEHPSMSVYQQSAILDDDEEEILIESSEEATPTPEVPPKREEAVVNPSSYVSVKRQVPHHGSRSMTITSNGILIAEIYEKGAALTTSRQKKLERRKTKMLQRNHLERNNKVRSYASANKNKRRKDHIKNPSGVNNNRRQY